MLLGANTRNIQGGIILNPANGITNMGTDTVSPTNPAAQAADTVRKADVEGAISDLQDQINSILGRSRDNFPCPGE